MAYPFVTFENYPVSILIIIEHASLLLRWFYVIPVSITHLHSSHHARSSSANFFGFKIMLLGSSSMESNGIFSKIFVQSRFSQAWVLQGTDLCFKIPRCHHGNLFNKCITLHKVMEAIVWMGAVRPQVQEDVVAVDQWFRRWVKSLKSQEFSFHQCPRACVRMFFVVSVTLTLMVGDIFLLKFFLGYQCCNREMEALMRCFVSNPINQQRWRGCNLQRVSTDVQVKG